jgi:glycosyltransferase involved in cell wall biosynthesis
MRFLMLNWRDPRNPLAGGAERVTLGYLKALVERGHEVFWFANAFSNCQPQEQIDGIHVVRGGGQGTSIFAARKWYRTQKRFDLVIDQHHGIPWFAPWWCHTHCIAYIHEVLGPIWSSFYPWPLSALGRLQERWTHWMYRKVPFWTACESTRDDLKRNGVRDITIIRYGVNTVALPELPPKRIETPLKLIAVSRLAPNKRIEHAIRAVASLKDRGIAARLKIVGTGEELSRLNAERVRLGLTREVEFTGSLSEAEKDRSLVEANWLLHTSQREGWGLNVIEANAMGTPAVVYPVAGLRESTLNDVTGLWSRDESPDALADRIIEGSRSDTFYQNLRLAAWARAKEFHWNRILPGACDWLEKMAGGEVEK